MMWTALLEHHPVHIENVSANFYMTWRLRLRREVAE